MPIPIQEDFKVARESLYLHIIKSIDLNAGSLGVKNLDRFEYLIRYAMDAGEYEFIKSLQLAVMMDYCVKTMPGFSGEKQNRFMTLLFSDLSEPQYQNWKNCYASIQEVLAASPKNGASELVAHFARHLYLFNLDDFSDLFHKEGLVPESRQTLHHLPLYLEEMKKIVLGSVQGSFFELFALETQYSVANNMADVQAVEAMKPRLEALRKSIQSYFKAFSKVPVV